METIGNLSDAAQIDGPGFRLDSQIPIGLIRAKVDGLEQEVLPLPSTLEHDLRGVELRDVRGQKLVEGVDYVIRQASERASAYAQFLRSRSISDDLYASLYFTDRTPDRILGQQDVYVPRAQVEIIREDLKLHRFRKIVEELDTQIPPGELVRLADIAEAQRRGSRFTNILKVGGKFEARQLPDLAYFINEQGFFETQCTGAAALGANMLWRLTAESDRNEVRDRTLLIVEPDGSVVGPAHVAQTWQDRSKKILMIYDGTPRGDEDSRATASPERPSLAARRIEPPSAHSSMGEKNAASPFAGEKNRRNDSKAPTSGWGSSRSPSASNKFGGGSSHPGPAATDRPGLFRRWAERAIRRWAGRPAASAEAAGTSVRESAASSEPKANTWAELKASHPAEPKASNQTEPKASNQTEPYADTSPGAKPPPKLEEINAAGLLRINQKIAEKTYAYDLLGGQLGAEFKDFETFVTAAKAGETSHYRKPMDEFMRDPAFPEIVPIKSTRRETSILLSLLDGSHLGEKFSLGPRLAALSELRKNARLFLQTQGKNAPAATDPIWRKMKELPFAGDDFLYGRVRRLQAKTDDLWSHVDAETLEIYLHEKFGHFPMRDNGLELTRRLRANPLLLADSAVQASIERLLKLPSDPEPELIEFLRDNGGRGGCRDSYADVVTQ